MTTTGVVFVFATPSLVPLSCPCVVELVLSGEASGIVLIWPCVLMDDCVPGEVAAIGVSSGAAG